MQVGGVQDNKSKNLPLGHLASNGYQTYASYLVGVNLEEPQGAC